MDHSHAMSSAQRHTKQDTSLCYSRIMCVNSVYQCQSQYCPPKKKSLDFTRFLETETLVDTCSAHYLYMQYIVVVQLHAAIS